MLSSKLLVTLQNKSRFFKREQYKATGLACTRNLSLYKRHRADRKATFILEADRDDELKNIQSVYAVLVVFCPLQPQPIYAECHFKSHHQPWRCTTMTTQDPDFGFEKVSARVETHSPHLRASH